MWRYLVLFCVFVGFVSCQSTSVSQCAFNPGQLPTNTYVEGCTQPPCILPQLQDAVIDIRFIAPRLISTMHTYLTAYLQLGPIVVPVIYDLGDDAVTCNFLNTTCPLTLGHNIQYLLSTHIHPFIPEGTSVTLEFWVLDQLNLPVFCFNVPVIIGPPQTSVISECEFNTGELPTYAVIEGCDEPPCSLPLLQEFVIHMNFRAPRRLLSMQSRLTAYIRLGNLVLPVAYDLGDAAYTCNFLNNTVCPVEQYELIQYSFVTRIDSSLPVNTEVTIEFKVEDENQDNVMCLSVPVRIEPALPSPVSECEFNEGALPIFTVINGCDSPPCLLHQGQNLYVNMNFRAPRDIELMRSHLVAYIRVVNLVLPVLIDLGQLTYTCNFLSNTECPLQQNELVQYTFVFPIEPTLPVNTEVTLEFRVEDQDQDAVICFSVPIRIEPPLPSVVTQCIVTSAPLPTSTIIEGCTEEPCLLPQLQDLVIHMNFIAPRPLESMRTYLVGYLVIGTIEIPVPIDLLENSFTCNFLTNTNCPVQQNEIVNYTLRVFVTTLMPIDTEGAVEIRVVDENNEPVVCIRWNARIASGAINLLKYDVLEQETVKEDKRNQLK